MGRQLKVIFYILVLGVQIFLISKIDLKEESIAKAKKTDTYWKETQLGSDEIEMLLSEDSCYESEDSFLGCVNSVSSMAERYHLVLDLDGTLRKFSSRDSEIRKTEKSELNFWKNEFKATTHLNFLDIFNGMMAKYSTSEERAFVISLGINGYLSIFKDPHSYLLPAKMYEEVVWRPENAPQHLGFISRESKDKRWVVRKVFEGSSAFKSGLQKGDVILEIDKVSIDNYYAQIISEKLKAKDTDLLNLTVRRGAQIKNLDIVRSNDEYPSVVSKIVNSEKGLGLITIHKFANNTCEAVSKQIVQLKEQNLKGLMLDLRDNPGGQVDEAACILNLFVKKGTLLFETRYLDRSRHSDFYYADNSPIYNGPIAVLINSGSASASEIVAGSLKDLGRALLVGERSFGKGSFQDGKIWGANEKILLFQTEGMYYFPSGWTTQLVGLVPDIEVHYNDTDLREEDLFYKPLMPQPQLMRPTSKAFANKNLNCELSEFKLLASTSEQDPQLNEAQSWLDCGFALSTRNTNDRNGSL